MNKIGIQQKETRDLIFIYETNPMINVLKYIKVSIYDNKIKLMNLYKNNYVINYINLDAAINKNYVFLCYIEDLKNLFSVITEDTVLYINDIDDKFIYFLNENSSFKIPILLQDDLPDEPYINLKYSGEMNLPLYFEQIKNVLIKGSNQEISNYLSFVVDKDYLYVINTDNRRIHSFIVENNDHLNKGSFIISCFFMDYIGKYNLSLHLTENDIVLKNHKSMIILGNPNTKKDFTKAYIAITKIPQDQYMNKFTVNKRVILEELRKHYMFSKEVYLHLKQNNVILYSKHEQIRNSDIKTNSHAYNIQFNEHQSVLLDTKHFADFIKAHNEQSIDIHLSNGVYIYSKNNLCSTKRM